MELKKAVQIATGVKRELSPFCERIEIAGSIRRLKPEVKDIEIVCKPKITWTCDIFGEMSQPRNHLHLHLNTMTLEGWKFLKDGPKYKQIVLPQGINLDLFIVTYPAQWGVQLVIRTGPKEFSKQMVTQRYKKGWLPNEAVVHEGAVWVNNEIVPMEEEIDFFFFCGIDWVFPQLRW